MKKAKTKQISSMLAVSVLLACTQSFGQFKTLRIGVSNETIGFPSLKITKLPIHPAVTIGTDFRVRSGKHWQRALGTDLYYSYKEANEHALMLDAAYRLGYKFNFGLQINLLTALGYKHAILTGDKYKLVDGEYKKASHWGKSQFNTKIGFGIEYPISKKYSILADYKAMAVAPFGDRILPFSINTFLGSGVRINLVN